VYLLWRQFSPLQTPITYGTGIVDDSTPEASRAPSWIRRVVDLAAGDPDLPVPDGHFPCASTRDSQHLQGEDTR
jgi:hypothetical protein